MFILLALSKNQIKNKRPFLLVMKFMIANKKITILERRLLFGFIHILLGIMVCLLLCV